MRPPPQKARCPPQTKRPSAPRPFRSIARKALLRAVEAREKTSKAPLFSPVLFDRCFSFGKTMAVFRKAMTEGLSERDSSDPLSLVLAGDARATFPVGEGFDEQQKNRPTFR